MTIRIAFPFLLLLLIASLTGHTRPYGKRIIRTSSFTGTGVEFFETTSGLADYYYSSDCTAIADSILIEITQTLQDTIIVKHEAVYLNFLNITDSTSIREYLHYSIPAFQPMFKYVIATDNRGRISACTTYNYADSMFILSSNWIFSYNSLNRPYLVLVDTAILHYRYEYAYDNLNRLSVWTEYRYQNSVWTPQNRKLIIYSEFAEPFPAPLHFLDLRLTYVINGRENLINSYDILYPVLSVTSQKYTNGSWINSSGSSYNSHLDPYEIVLYYSYLSGLSSGETNHCFGYDGYFTGTESMYNLGQITSSHVTWEDYTPILEDCHPSPVSYLSILVSPNPFRTNLRLSLDKAVPAAADISIYNLKGQLIRSWKDVKAPELTWDGKDSNNCPVSSGVYLIRARQGKAVSTSKAIKF